MRETWQRLKPLSFSVYVPIVAIAFVWTSILPVFPRYLAGLGAGVAVTGVVLSMKGFGQIVSDVPGGMILSRFGLRRVSLWAFFFAILANALLAVTTSVRVIGVLVFVTGFFTSVLLTASMAQVRLSLEPGFRGRALSFAGGALRLGALLGPFAGGIVAESLGVTVLFAVNAAVLALGLVLRYRAPGTKGQGRQQIEGGIFGQFRVVAEGLRGRWKALISTGFVVLALMVLRSARELILPLWGGHLGLSPSRIGLAMSGGAALELFVFVPAGIISDTRGRKTVGTLCAGIFAAGLYLLFVSGGFPLFLVAILVMGLGNGLGAGINMTTGTDLTPRGAVAPFLGLWRLYGDIGVTAGPLIVGAVASVLTLGSSVLVTALLGTLGAAVMAFVAPETLHIAQMDNRLEEE